MPMQFDPNDPQIQAMMRAKGPGAQQAQPAMQGGMSQFGNRPPGSGGPVTQVPIPQQGQGGGMPMRPPNMPQMPQAPGGQQQPSMMDRMRQIQQLQQMGLFGGGQGGGANPMAAIGAGAGNAGGMTGGDTGNQMMMLQRLIASGLLG